MTIAMLLIHHHTHSFRELKILVDVLWALHKNDGSMDWGKLTCRLKEIGLAKTTIISLHQLETLWPEEAGLRAVKFLKQGMKDLGCSCSRCLLSYFRIDVQRTVPYNAYHERLMARFALDDWRTILLSFLTVLVPIPEAISALYNDRRFWTLPINYLRYIIWRVREWTR